MKFHTTLGLRQTHCVIFIFISTNTIAALNTYCKLLACNRNFPCLEVKGQPLADHVRPPFEGLLQCRADGHVGCACPALPLVPRAHPYRDDYNWPKCTRHIFSTCFPCPNLMWSEVRKMNLTVCLSGRKLHKEKKNQYFVIVICCTEKLKCSPLGQGDQSGHIWLCVRLLAFRRTTPTPLLN